MSGASLIEESIFEGRYDPYGASIMKAVGYLKSAPLSDPESLIDFNAADPVPGERDLLVEIRAVSVNPVDVKVRARRSPKTGETAILGWDAAGVVRSVGAKCSLFQPGDEVYYAGALDRAGSNSELHVVDERIVGRKPRNIDFAESAALPLTSITAWELLFDRLDVRRQSGKSLLIIGGAGGVGSVLIQIARQLTDLTIIATASRPETISWCKELGAHHVIDHSQSLSEQLKAVGIPEVDLIASLTGTEQHLLGLAEVIKPQGKLGVIDDPSRLDINPFKSKSVSVHWEFMFTRSMYGTADLIEQHGLLNEVSSLVEASLIKTTVGEKFGKISAENLKRAHEVIESGRAKGKIVLEGF